MHYSVILCLLTIHSFLNASILFDKIASDSSYRFSLKDEHNSIEGFIERKDDQFYWKTDSEDELNFLLSREHCYAFDDFSKTITHWPYNRSKELHPFLEHWYSLVDLDKNAFKNNKGTTQWQLKKSTFSFSWNKDMISILWQRNQPDATNSLRLEVQLLSKGPRKFDFSLPTGWKEESLLP